jgi:hypothetical protein
MEQDERSYLEDLTAIHRRRLQILERKQAQFGINTPPEVEMEIEDIGAEIKKLNDRLHRVRAINVDLLCYMEIAPRDGTTVPINWTEHFLQGVAPTEVWTQTLLPDLDRVYRQIGRASPEPAVALRQRATISAGLAFGFVFSAASGIRVWVEQRTDDREVQWWAAQEESPTIVGLLLDEQRTPLDPQSHNTLVEVGVAQDVGQSVNQWLQSQPDTFAEHIRFVPDLGPGRTVVPDAAHVLAMARQIETACMRAHSARSAGTIHLFVAAPFGLALMIGRKLNACGRVQCYDFDKGAGRYVPSCLLNAPIA